MPPSDKVRDILRSISTLTPEQVSKLTEREAWGEVFKLKGGNYGVPKRDTVCFTGFDYTFRDQLWNMAFQKGFDVKGAVTHELTFLVTGPSPGPSKMRLAKEYGVIILNLEEFEEYVKTGKRPKVT